MMSYIEYGPLYVWLDNSASRRLFKRFTKRRSFRLNDGARCSCHHATGVVELMKARWRHDQQAVSGVYITERMKWADNVENSKLDLFKEIIVAVETLDCDVPSRMS